MPFFSKQYNLGLDIGSSLIKACIARRGGRTLVLRMATPRGMVSKGVLQQLDEIGQVRQWVRKHQLGNYSVVATLPASTLVLRHIQIPKLNPQETAEAVQWEARRVLPFPLEEAQTDWLSQGTVTSEDGEMQDILLVAVRDSLVDRYVAAVKEAGLRLVALDIAPMALGRWLLKEAPDSSLIIDIGAETTQVHFFDGTRLIFSRSLSIGGLEATKAIVAIESGSFEDAEVKKLRGDYREEWMDNWLSELGRELQRSLEYYHNNYVEEGGENFQRVILTGGASLTRGVENLIENMTGVEPGYAEFATRDRRPRHDKIMYNIALGAGMWEG